MINNNLRNLNYSKHPNNYLVQMLGVSVSYDNVVALDSVDFVVEKNDFIGIIGPNGGGKTTLLRVILGLIKPDSGTIELFGTNPDKARKQIGYVAQYQNFDRDFPINVWGVVLMGRLGHAGMLRGFSQTDKDAAKAALQKVGMYQHRERQVSELSGGQQQRVLIARALATRPGLLLLDEPLSSIDSTMHKSFYDILAELNKEMAIVMVSHDITSVSLIVNKIACLNKKLYYHGSNEITSEDLEATYQCPVELIAHGIPHRVLKEHPR